MPRPISITNANKSLFLDLYVNEEGQLSFQRCSARPKPEDWAPDLSLLLSPVEIQCTGESTTRCHGYRHNAGVVSTQLRYVGRNETQNGWGKSIELILAAPNGLEVTWHLQTYNEINIVRSWCTLQNRGEEEIGLEYVSSFVCPCLCANGEKRFPYKTEVYVPHNSWYGEAQWTKHPIEDLGISRMLIDGYNNSPGVGTSRYAYGSFGSWSTCDYLPMGMAEDTETGEIFYWQIESSCAWKAEYATTDGHNLSVALSGPTENEAHWWKCLKPGESFQTVTEAFGVTLGGVSEAVGELTRYRRVIRRPNEDDERLNVVFNDFMNCLMGDPREENELPMIRRAAELGCEYYCIDCGWYDKGFWWDRVGEWKESPERFPNGLNRLFDEIRACGMKPGAWIEIEVMGTACELAQQLPDDWFFQRHGRRHIDNKRYLLDFRNPAVRNYATSVMERLIEDYGLQYFKVDYNVTTLFGSDYQSDSCGDALLEHVRALHGWYASLYKKYPFLVIENCGSGGMRMDYGMLQGQSLQSTSDQTDYLYNSYIAANVASAVTPEQCGMWVYPYEDEREHVIYNMVNGLLLRPYISGQVMRMSESSLQLLRQGIDLYKEIRPEVRQGIPFFPLGFTGIRDEALAYGLRGKKRSFLSVFLPRTNHVRIPLAEQPASVRVLYPQEEDCQYRFQDGCLEVTVPQAGAARLFELVF